VTAHVFPHVPQLRVSVVVSTHAPPHVVSVGLHVGAVSTPVSIGPES
jgi:hypothetical protein